MAKRKGVVAPLRSGSRRGKARVKIRGKARPNHKDGLFCRLFAEPENALSLYNALTGSSYTEADGLEIVTLKDAVDSAVDACISRGGKLADFMRKHKAEVDVMYLFGVDFEKIHREAMKEEARKAKEEVRKAKEEARKQGLADGRMQGLADGLRNILKNTSMTLSQAMDALGIQEADRAKYAAMLS